MKLPDVVSGVVAVCQCVFVCQLFVSSAVCIWARRDRCGSVTPLYSPCSPMEGMREPSILN